MTHGIRLFLFLAILAALASALLTIGDEPEVEVKPVVSGVSVDEQTPAPAVDGPDAPVRAIEEEGDLGGVDDEGLFDPLPADQKQKPEFPGQFGRIRGRVLSAAGQPLPGHVVQFRPAESSGRGSPPEATTDELGEFDSGKLVVGGVSIVYLGPSEWVDRSGGRSGWRAGHVDLAREEVRDYDVRLPGDRALVAGFRSQTGVETRFFVELYAGTDRQRAIAFDRRDFSSSYIGARLRDSVAAPEPLRGGGSSVRYFGLAAGVYALKVYVAPRGVEDASQVGSGWRSAWFEVDVTFDSEWGVGLRIEESQLEPVTDATATAGSSTEG